MLLFCGTKGRRRLGEEEDIVPKSRTQPSCAPQVRQGTAKIGTIFERFPFFKR